MEDYGAFRFMISPEQKQTPTGEAVNVRNDIGSPERQYIIRDDNGNYKPRMRGTIKYRNGEPIGLQMAPDMYIKKKGEYKDHPLRNKYLHYDKDVNGFVMDNGDHIPFRHLVSLSELADKEPEVFHSIQEYGSKGVRKGETVVDTGENRDKEANLRDSEKPVKDIREYLEEKYEDDKADADEGFTAEDYSEFGGYDGMNMEDLLSTIYSEILGMGGDTDENMVLSPHNEGGPYITVHDAPHYGFSIVGKIDPLRSILSNYDLTWGKMSGLSGKQGAKYHDALRKLWAEDRAGSGEGGLISRAIGADFMTSPMFESLTKSQKDVFYRLLKDKGYVSFADVRRFIRDSALRKAKRDKDDVGILGNSYYNRINGYVPSKNLVLPEDLIYDKLVDSLYRTASKYTKGENGASSWHRPKNLKLMWAYVSPEHLIGNDAVMRGEASSQRDYAQELLASQYTLGDVISDAQILLSKDSPFVPYIEDRRAGKAGQVAFERAFGRVPTVSDETKKNIVTGIRAGLEPLYRQRHIVDGLMRGLQC